MISRFLILLTTALAGAMAVPMVMAQPVGPRITPSLSARTLGVGQQAVLSYQITAEAGNVEVFPQNIEVPGLTIVYSGQTQRLTMIQGVRQSEITYRYTVLGQTAGDYTVPAQQFVVNGQNLEAPALALTVREGDPVDEELLPTVQLGVGKTEFWKGEVIPLQVAVLVHPSVSPLSPFFPQLKSPNFAVTRFDRSAGLEAREVNGEIWRAWQMESVMTALQAGAHKVGPAEVKAELLIPFPGQTNDPFLGRQQGRRRTLTLTSNTVPVNVKELPAEGKPADFNGAVGQFELDMQASPVSLKAGDPIAVEIGITGTGNFDAITAPKLESTDGWRLYEPRVSLENRGWGSEEGRKSFTQILIPERPQTEIPAFVLHFFDPETETYITRRSDPVALTITGDFKAEASADAGSRDFAEASGATPPMEELGDILDRPLIGTSTWMATAATPISANRWLLHGVPALLMILLIGRGIFTRTRAALLARRPPPGTPREPYAILTELRRKGHSRKSFYILVNEYLQSASHHHHRTLPSQPDADRVVAARDRWLYGSDEGASRLPLPEDEQKQVLETLGRI